MSSIKVKDLKNYYLREPRYSKNRSLALVSCTSPLENFTSNISPILLANTVARSLVPYPLSKRHVRENPI